MVMHMRVVVLDYAGTLTTVDDPERFVTQLQERGDRVVIWSGHDQDQILQDFPRLFDRASYEQKPTHPEQVVARLGLDPPADEVVVVDDMEMTERMVSRIDRKRPERWRYLSPDNIQTLL